MVEPVKNCTTCKHGVQIKGNLYECTYSAQDWDSSDPKAILMMGIIIRTDTIKQFDFPKQFRGDGVKRCNKYEISDQAREVAQETFTVNARLCKVCGRILTGKESVQSGCGASCAARLAKKMREQNDPNQMSFYGKDEINESE